MLQLRDQPGTSAAAPGAHSNAFDRVRALQDGVENGAATCAGYIPRARVIGSSAALEYRAGERGGMIALSLARTTEVPPAGSVSVTTAAAACRSSLNPAMPSSPHR
jgi:hypothetical protein